MRLVKVPRSSLPPVAVGPFGPKCSQSEVSPNFKAFSVTQIQKEPDSKISASDSTTELTKPQRSRKQLRLTVPKCWGGRLKSLAGDIDSSIDFNRENSPSEAASSFEHPSLRKATFQSLCFSEIQSPNHQTDLQTKPQVAHSSSPDSKVRTGRGVAKKLTLKTQNGSEKMFVFH